MSVCFPALRAASSACAVALVGVTSAASASTFSFLPLPPLVLPDNHFPTMTAGADLDGSGLPDLVVPGRGIGGRVQVLRNIGGGVLEIRQTLEIGGQTDWAALGDLDGDGHLDLALSLRNGPRGLMTRAGIGDGTFATAGQHLPEARELSCIALVDLNNNGALDAAGVDYSGGVLRLYRNDGTGTLTQDPPMRLVGHAGGFVSAPDIVAADLDGDGAMDLVVTATGSSRVIKLRNRGDGTFKPSVNHGFAPFNGYGPGLINTIPADMNGDGSLDLVTPWIISFIGQVVSILPNDGEANFGDPILNTGVFGSASYRGAVADFDGDGKLDVAVGHALTGVLGLNRNLGDFVLAPSQVIPIGTFVRHILPLDMTGDGVIDLVVCDAPNHLVQVLVNETPQAAGGLAGGEPASLDRPRGDAPERPAFRDPPSDRLRQRLAAEVDLDSSVDGADIALWLQERQ